MPNLKKQHCSECNCTDDHACPGGCYWAAPNLCSKCVPGKEQAAASLHYIAPKGLAQQGTVMMTLAALTKHGNILRTYIAALEAEVVKLRGIADEYDRVVFGIVNAQNIDEIYQAKVALNEAFKKRRLILRATVPADKAVK